MVPSSAVALGQVLDHYRLTAQIGHGGMGIVYRACDERLQRDVAVKVLHSDVLEDAAARSRFSQEALAGDFACKIGVINNLQGDRTPQIGVESLVGYPHCTPA